jgi:hypothetical protein
MATRPPTTTARLPRRLVLALAVALLPATPRAQSPLEIAVKAAYLYKFAPFVDWPAEADSTAPFAICVIGADPFGPVLERAVSGQRVGERPIVVRRLSLAVANPPCQIAYLGGTRAQPVKDALRILRGSPILTVTEGSDPAGIIDLGLVDGRVRFRIDEQAAADNRLTISSKLLSLALAVRPRKAAA